MQSAQTKRATEIEAVETCLRRMVHDGFLDDGTFIRVTHMVHVESGRRMLQYDEQPLASQGGNGMRRSV